MELEIEAVDSELPVMITLDHDNGIYTIRKSDTSGEVFNNAKDLLTWYQENMSVDLFTSVSEYEQSLNWITSKVYQ